MQVNLDYRELLLLDISRQSWFPSPGGEVMRCLLERDGAESGLATSLVRYPAGARFPEHEHPGGEEILVLEGIFADEHGTYPAGTYLRNPLHSQHAPYSQEGCLIFVKLRQMRPGQMACQRRGLFDLKTSQTLYQDRYESVSLQVLKMGQIQTVSACEVLLLEGAVQVGKRRYEALSWFRVPAGQTLQVKGLKKTRFWLKHGHLELL